MSCQAQRCTLHDVLHASMATSDYSVLCESLVCLPCKQGMGRKTHRHLTLMFW